MITVWGTVMNFGRKKNIEKVVWIIDVW